MAALLRTLAERIGKGEGADTADVHVEREQSLARHGETANASRGQPARGERRRGLEDDVLQRNHRFQKTQRDYRYEDDYQRHDNDGIGLVHQRERNGLLVELDTLLPLDGGEKRLDDDKGCGGLDAAARGTRRRPDEDYQGDDHQHWNTYRIDIHDIETCRAAGCHLEKRSEHFVEKGASVCQSVVILQEEKENRAHRDNEKGSEQGNPRADGQRLPPFALALADDRRREKVTQHHKTDAANEHQQHDDDLREVAVDHRRVHQPVGPK